MCVNDFKLSFNFGVLQDQDHSAQSDKWFDKVDPNIGWNGITKATPLKQFPAEEPNRTNPVEVISKLRDNDKTMDKVNLNNVYVKEEQVRHHSLSQIGNDLFYLNQGLSYYCNTFLNVFF